MTFFKLKTSILTAGIQVFCLLLSPQVWAFDQFSSAFMEILANDSVKPEESTRDPWFIRPFHSSIYNPSGEVGNLSQAPKNCLNLDFFKTGQSFTEGSQKLNQAWKECEPFYFSGYTDPLSQILRTTGIEFNRSEYPWAKTVQFSLETGDRLRGLLFLKDFETKRPIVILRGGIFSSSKGIKAELYLMLMMFEQSQANVLFLESTSSPQYQARNKRWVYLGAEEGYQLLEVAEKIQSQSEPLSKLISEVSLAGVSLGGNGVLFANLIQQELIKEKKPQVFKKSIAFCPLVDGEATLNHHLQNPISRFVLDQTLEVRYNRLRKMKSAVDLTMAGIVRSVELESPPVIPRKFPVPLVLKEKIKTDGKTFWNWNSFWMDYQKIETPILIFATQNDTLVPFELNSKKLLQNSEGSVVNLVELSRGQHCSIPGAYNWFPFSKIINNYLFSDSIFPKVRKTISESSQLTPGQFDEFSAMGPLVDVKSEGGKEFLNVSIKKNWWEFWKQKELIFKVELNRSNINLLFSENTPHQPLENHLVRWFNSNLKIEFVNESTVLKISWPYFGQQ